MRNDQKFNAVSKVTLLLLGLMATVSWATDISNTPLITYSATSTTDVKPNVFFVLDDSGSMAWEYLPDQTDSSSEYLFRNSNYNGVAYSPATRYKPPVHVNSSGVIDTTTYPNMTGVDVTTGGDGSASTASPNWRAVKNDAYGVQDLTGAASQARPYTGQTYPATNLTPSSPTSTSPSPYFYTTIPGEYCKSASLRVCNTQSAPDTTYPFPAYTRWCSSSALSTCQAAYDSSTFSFVRMPSPRTSTITIAGSSSTSVSGITVNSLQIMSGTAAASTNASTLAANIAAQINNCTYVISGNCQIVGYAASSSSGVVTITAPVQTSSTPVITKTGSMTLATVAFSNGAIPGENLRTTITPSVTSYPYPGSTTKAAARTDCAGTTCTYTEEMTNYANWWTYHHTRMQTMKTSASNAFANIDSTTDIAGGKSRFRLGFMAMNNNGGNKFVNLGEFTGAKKYEWFSKLTAASPNSGTPLRQSLSDAGLLYAGKLNGTSYNDVTVTDPLQYSCQQNYTILSTDGFWNGNGGYKLDGNPTNNTGTPVGNQDGDWTGAYGDGATSQLQASTSTLQRASFLATYTKETTQLQQRTLRSNGSWRSWSNATSCTLSSTTDCQYVSTGTSTVSSCTPVAQSTGPSFTVASAVLCTRNVGTKTNATGSCTMSATTWCGYTAPTTYANVTTCVAVPQDTGPTFTVLTARSCQTSVSGGTSDTLADVAAYYYRTDLRSPTATGVDATGTCTGPIISPSTTPTDLCADNVAGAGKDTITTQHMTTFTLGLGAPGQMIYAPNDGRDYWNDSVGDFYDVKNLSTATPSTGICSWQSSGKCYWPTPVSNTNANIDDLWHAAVNGRGTYFSAKDSASLTTSLETVLKTISNVPRPGTAAAAASSNPNVSKSDNFVFSSSYKSVDWFGELVRQEINAGTLSNQNWSAMRLLDCATTPWVNNFSYFAGNVYRQGSTCYLVVGDYTSGATFDGSSTGVDGQSTYILNQDEAATTLVPAVAQTSRTIYTNNSSNGALIPFNWSDLVTAGLSSYFTQSYLSTVVNTTTGATRVSQFCTVGVTCLSSGNQASASGATLVNFLRGERINENTFFRKRKHVLGDIVNSEARYVKTPLFNYVDTGYSDYKTAMKTRAGMVYVGANDGMLHAFDATLGQEKWAYIPRPVLPNLYALADMNYGNTHQYFVDNSPETGDISVPCSPVFPATTCNLWKTILVGGLNAGGTSYYALDITDPVNPVFLWEFTDTNMGYSYGNPRITKLKDGTWVVMVTSGYNNADGKGYVYVLNAQTGALIRSISTNTGTAAVPSGLARISAQSLTADTNNTVTAVYGGDLLGNLWRFDVNGDMGASGYDAQLLISLQDAANNPQPITAKPTVSMIGSTTVVYVGTGQYLGITDISNKQYQSFYGVKDTGGSTTLTTPRAGGSLFVQQVLTNTTCPASAPASVCSPGDIVRLSTSNPVDWSTNNGWYVDFLGAGERANTDASLGLGTLLFSTNLPSLTSADVCGDPATSGAKSFLYALDYKTGGPVANTAGVSGLALGNGAATRPIMVMMPDGTVYALTRVSGGGSTTSGSTSTGGGGGGTDMGGGRITTPPINKGSGSGLRRLSWRELTAQ